MQTYWLLLPIIIALVLSIKLSLFSKVESKASQVLGFFFFLFLTVLSSLFLVSGLLHIESISFLINLFSLLFYVAVIALPPTVYLYTFYLTSYEDNKFHFSKILPHYSLTLSLLSINLIAYIYFLITPEADSTTSVYLLVENVMTYSNFFALIFVFPISNIYYCYKSFVNYSSHKNTIKDYFSYDKGISLKWIKTFLIGYILFIAVIYFIFLSSVGNNVAFISSGLIAYLVFIGYKGDRQFPIIISDVNEEEVELESDDLIVLEDSAKDKEINSTVEITQMGSKISISPNAFSEEKQLELKEKLLNFMSKEKPYLNSKLTIHELSKQLNTNNKYLSKIINNSFKQNFVTFINSYRIEESKKLLLDTENDNYTIESIANMAGFHSRSTFNTAFKNITGVTPSKFKKVNSTSAIGKATA